MCHLPIDRYHLHLASLTADPPMLISGGDANIQCSQNTSRHIFKNFYWVLTHKMEMRKLAIAFLQTLAPYFRNFNFLNWQYCLTPLFFLLTDHVARFENSST